MNDSRTLEYWKRGQWGRALLRTTIYASGFFLGMFILTLVALVVVFLIMSPAMAFLLDQLCRYTWGS